MVRILDSNASLLVLLLANFFLLELVDDQRWGALGSTLLAALALVVAISDPESGHRLSRRHWLQVGACVALAPLVLIVNSTSVVGLTYLLPVGLLVTATLPVTLRRILKHRRVTRETVLGGALRVRARRSAVRVRLSRRERVSQRAVLRAARAA